MEGKVGSRGISTDTRQALGFIQKYHSSSRLVLDARAQNFVSWVLKEFAREGNALLLSRKQVTYVLDLKAKYYAELIKSRNSEQGTLPIVYDAESAKSQNTEQEAVPMVTKWFNKRGVEWNIITLAGNGDVIAEIKSTSGKSTLVMFSPKTGIDPRTESKVGYTVEEFLALKKPRRSFEVGQEVFVIRCVPADMSGETVVRGRVATLPKAVVSTKQENGEATTTEKKKGYKVLVDSRDLEGLRVDADNPLYSPPTSQMHDNLASVLAYFDKGTARTKKLMQDQAVERRDLFGKTEDGAPLN